MFYSSRTPTKTSEVWTISTVRRRNRIFPWVFCRDAVYPDLNLGSGRSALAFDLQNYKVATLCCFKVPGLRRFSTATTAHQWVFFFCPYWPGSPHLSHDEKILLLVDNISPVFHVCISLGSCMFWYIPSWPAHTTLQAAVCVFDPCHARKEWRQLFTRAVIKHHGQANL